MACGQSFTLMVESTFGLKVRLSKFSIFLLYYHFAILQTLKILGLILIAKSGKVMEQEFHFI